LRTRLERGKQSKVGIRRAIVASNLSIRKKGDQQVCAVGGRDYESPDAAPHDEEKKKNHIARRCHQTQLGGGSPKKEQAKRFSRGSDRLKIAPGIWGPSCSNQQTKYRKRGVREIENFLGVSCCSRVERLERDASESECKLLTICKKGEIGD